MYPYVYTYIWDMGKVAITNPTLKKKIMTCSIEKLIDFRKDVLHLFEEYFSDLIDGTEKKLLNESTVSADTTTTDAVPSIQQPTIVRSSGIGKQFVEQNSLLTDLFKSTHFRTIYHIFIASLIMLILNLMIQELALNGSINLKLDLFYWCFGKFPMLITIWLSMFSSVVLLLYPSYHCWAYNVENLPSLNILFLTLYIAYMAALIVVPIHYVLKFDLPLATTMVIACEQVRFLMKAYSFVRENVPKSFQYKAMKQRNKQKADTVRDPCPDFGRFLYFLFAPTLIYRDNYPRKSKVEWKYVVRNFVEVAGCLFYAYYLFIHFCEPIFQNFNKDHVTWRNYLLASLGCVLPGSLCFVLAFFAVLHCWMNAFAEMLQFSDRLFYADWWNATSMSSYYRRWNIIVHDWLYAYVYQDMQPLFGDSYRTAAMTVVFLLSAVVHEYIITLTLRFFYPVLFIQFFLCAGPIGIMRLMRSTNTRAWNVCLWFLIMLGNGILMCTYSCEWYARSNCPPVYNNFLDLIIPRSWTCQADAAEVIRLRR
ncbi:Sterol O-acyltransferase [Trichinella spiralis]|uniref:O-acyltransferase n=1 Tax=Trichinella spiralis TaxID=6334 RepID=A0ABR3KEC2_TRISP